MGRDDKVLRQSAEMAGECEKLRPNVDAKSLPMEWLYVGGLEDASSPSARAKSPGATLAASAQGIRTAQGGIGASAGTGERELKRKHYGKLA